MSKYETDPNYLKALYITNGMWIWLRNNIENNIVKSKSDWPDYKKYKKYLTTNTCAICTLREKYYPTTVGGFCGSCNNMETCAFISFCGDKGYKYNKMWLWGSFIHKKNFARVIVKITEYEINKYNKKANNE